MSKPIFCDEWGNILKSRLLKILPKMLSVKYTSHLWRNTYSTSEYPAQPADLYSMVKTPGICIVLHQLYHSEQIQQDKKNDNIFLLS